MNTIVTKGKPKKKWAPSDYSIAVAEISKRMPTYNAVCMKKGCNYSKINRLRVAEHVAVKHMGLMPECVVGCGSFSSQCSQSQNRMFKK